MQPRTTFTSPCLIWTLKRELCEPRGSCSAEFLMVHTQLHTSEDRKAALVSAQEAEGIPDLCCCNTPTPPEYNLSSLEVSPRG